MASILRYPALILAYIATLFLLGAMVTPWWYTKYYPVDSNDDTFYNNNPSISRDTGLFDRTNCFIDGSCITGHTIYKNNSSLQWVYTTILVLMIVAWIPWLFFVHLVHNRAHKDRAPVRGSRVCMVISALLTWLIVVAAIIVFAVGMVKTNGVYNSGGLYGHKQVLISGSYAGIGSNINDKGRGDKRQITDITESLSEAAASLTASASNVAVSASGVAASLTASASDVAVSASGIAASLTESASDVAVSASNVFTGSSETTATSAPTGTASGSDSAYAAAFGYNGQESDNFVYPVSFGTLPYGGRSLTLLGAGIPVISAASATGLVGTLGYKYGAHSAWYCAIFFIALLPLALIFGLLIKAAEKVVTQTRTVERTVTTQPAVVPQMGYQQPAYLPGQQPQFAQTTVNRAM